MKTSRLIVSVLVIALMLPTVASGQAPPTITYEAGVQIQNQGTATANITIIYYKPDGTEAATVTDSITLSEGSKTYFPITALNDGFKGSAVVSSDQPVAAIVNLLGTKPGGEQWGFGGASYNSEAAGATTVLLPLIMKDNSGFSTWFSVQNTGTGDANVLVTYSNGVTQTATIKAGAAATFDQYSFAGLPNGFVGSAKITSNQPVAAAVVELGQSTMFAYNGFADSSAEVVMPLVNANNSGYITGIQIQNAGTVATAVTVAYTPSSGQPGTACQETKTIQPGTSATFALYAFSLTGDPAPGTHNCAFGETFIGSAEVLTNTASQPLVAIVNQLNLGENKGASYSGFDPAKATATVGMPLIMDRNSSYFTGFSVTNVGTAQTGVTCTFANSTHTESATLQPGQSLTPIQLNVIGDGYVGSAVCVAGTNGKIVGIVNELNMDVSGDAFLVYNGFNQ